VRVDLDFKFGAALQDYTFSRDPFPFNGSLLSLMVVLAVNNSRARIPNIIIANSGGLRFDVYAGRFTRNDQLTASPFTDAFLYIAGVPLCIASAVTPALNRVMANARSWYKGQLRRSAMGMGTLRSDTGAS
jgi:hypothetical protein